MAQEGQAIHISDIPALRGVVREVVRTQRRQELRVDGEAVTLIVKPMAYKRSRTLRSRPTTADDPMWGIIGIAEDEQATDVSVNHDTYLAEAKLSRSQ